MSKYKAEIPMSDVEEPTESVQDWRERQSVIDEDWDSTEDQIMEDFLEHSAFFRKCCDICKKCSKSAVLVRCFSCMKLLCADCDVIFLESNPFHSRWLTSESAWKPLAAMDFVDANGEVFQRGF